MRDTLQDAFETKRWDSRDGYPRSGAGSTLDATRKLRQALPRLFDTYNVKTFLDAPCGDWFWMQHVAFGDVSYIGADISEEVIAEVSHAHADTKRQFMHLDITHDPLPAADMMLCRDCLFHLTNDMKWAFFENFARSKISYLLLTMNHVLVNDPIKNNGDFAKFNPCLPPFNFPQPIEMVHESERVNLRPRFLATPRGSWQRSLGLWSRDEVVDAL